ncbi:tetratricopeptide repeat protein [Saccharicrinis sp. FJH54]|uniref:tetratricopeptide repeat-containing sensor histidine kinase n=1 Tax=Saccharicrinis sp. FJH54 TaxID=3344665 RepID=UPI0035D43227
MTLNLSGQTINSGTDGKPRVSTNYEKVLTYSKLCWQNREKDTDKAIEYGNQGIEIAQKYGYKKELGKLYNYVGVIYQHYKFDVQKAISYYDLGLPYCLEVKDSVEIAFLYNNLGDAFYSIGNVPYAFEYTEKSMLLFQNLKNKRGMAYSYINMGELNRMKEDYTTALGYFNKAISLRRELKDSVGIASAYLELAHTLFLMDKTDEALSYYRYALQKNQAINNVNFMAYSMQGMGNVFLKKELADSAGSYFSQALELCKSRQNLSGEIDSQLGMAKTMALEGKTKEGERYLNDALKNARKSKIAKDILNVYKARGNYFEQQKKYRESAQNYQNYVEVYDSVFNALQFTNLKDIKDRFMITEQLNAAKENIKMKKKIQIYAALFIIILVVLSIILYMRSKKISRLSSELLKSNQTKDKIFSIISHDLISPFNVLIGSSELLMQNLNNNRPERAKITGQIIQQTSESAFQLVSNLLNWSRSQQKRIKLFREEFDLTLLMKEVKNMSENHAAYKNISVYVEPEERMIINADKNLLQIVLINLLNNALKFTGKNGVVNIKAERKERQVIVYVKDNGTGIEPEKLTRIFNSQEIESTEGTKNEKGTGLGLMLCKEFIALHDGSIHMKSTVGEGSEFRFNIPLS